MKLAHVGAGSVGLRDAIWILPSMHQAYSELRTAFDRAALVNSVSTGWRPNCGVELITNCGVLITNYGILIANYSIPCHPAALHLAYQVDAMLRSSPTSFAQNYQARISALRRC